MKIYYNHNLKERSREMRKNSTPTEIMLWSYLKGKHVKGYAFTRQKPIHNYIVDFYCPRLSLVIEIDGPIHNFQTQEDRFRQGEIESLGISFLRFSDDRIKNDIQAVLKEIEKRMVELEKR